MNNIIKLAEAMGLNWKRVKHDGCNAVILQFNQLSGWTIFDPFTDANDDYAVLEWIGANHDPQEVINAFESLDSGNCCDMYEVGNNARAALKVIDKSKDLNTDGYCGKKSSKAGLQAGELEDG